MKPIALSNSLCQALNITPSNELPQRHGEVCLANDSLITQANWAPIPTTFGTGYADPNRNQLAALRDYLAPRRNSARKCIVRVYDEDEPFETVDYKKVKRNPLGDFPEIKQRTVTTSTRLLVNRGLTCRLDRDQLPENPEWQNMHTAWMIDLLTRASILEALALHTAIATADTWTWDSAANPDLDVKNTIINTLVPVIGFYPNRGLYGDQAGLQRQISYESQDKAVANAAAALLSDQQIATRTGLQQVRTQAERYDSSGTKVTFLGKKVLLFTGVDAETPEDPSNVVRHVAAATYGGGDYAVYVTEVGVKSIFITVENYELLHTQHTGGEFLATIN